MPSPSYLRLTKSETRDLAEHEARARRATSQNEGWSEEKSSGNGRFFIAFVVIVGLLAVFALVLR